MKNFKASAGIDVSLNNYKLVYDQEKYPVEQQAREYTDALDVYLEKGSYKQILYWMYRYFESTDEKPVFDKFGLEYDLTVLKNGQIGVEYIKTVGHYHASLKGKDMSYPEVYEVLEGQIEYILQTIPDKGGKVDVIVVQAKHGDKVIVPPNYGHVSVNVGSSVALSANIQKKDLPAGADYDTFKKFQGAALFRTAEGLKENDKYKIKSLRIVIPKEKPEFGLTRQEPLYTSFLAHPEKFDFLNNPQKYDFSDIFEDIKL
jgi:glucose-6-phosphate isomerase